LKGDMPASAFADGEGQALFKMGSPRG